MRKPHAALLMLACIPLLLSLESRQHFCHAAEFGDLDYYDALLDTALQLTEEDELDVVPRLQRVNSVNVFHGLPTRNDSVENNQDLAVCQMDFFLPFSLQDSFPNVGNEYIFLDITVALLAIHHLNNGIGDVIPALQGLNETCDVRFTSKFFDTESTPNIAMDYLYKEIHHSTERRLGPGRGPAIQPCAVIGEYNGPVTAPLATLATLSNLFHAPTTTVDYFDDKEVYPTVGRLSPAISAVSSAIVSYLKMIGVRHVVLLYPSEEHLYEMNFVREAANVGIKTVTVQISSDLGDTLDQNSDVKDPKIHEAVQHVMDKIKETEFRYVFAKIHYDQYELFMEAAYERGVAGPGYNWIIGNNIYPSEIQGFASQGKYKPGEPLYIATQGVSVFYRKGAMRSEAFPSYENLIDAWGKVDENMVNYVNSKWPQYDKSEPRHNFTVPYAKLDDFAEDSFFFPPDFTTSIIYDTIAKIGLSACSAAAKNNNGTEKTYFTGKDQFNEFVSMDVEGVTGKLKVTPGGSRDPTSLLYSIVNIVSNEEQPQENGEYSFEARDTYLLQYDPETKLNTWKPNPNEEPHVYSDGTTTAPSPIPVPVENMHHISPGMRGTLLLFCAIVLLLSVACGMFAYGFRKKKVVRAAQPFFLFMICIGTVFMGSTMIPLTIDDGIASIQGCNIACMAAPWLYAVGFVITFSALFSKTWRINRIVRNANNFKRVQITRNDVLPPFAVLLLINFVILSLWTALAPLQWDRRVTTTDKFGTPTASYGLCASSNPLQNKIYVFLLCFINIGVLLFANYQAYLSRNLQTDFNESHYIALAMASIFQVWFIGIPLVFFLYDQPNSSLFVKSGIVIITCLAVLLLLFVPKMIAVRRTRNDRMSVTSSTLPMSAIQTAVSGMNGGKETPETADQVD